MLRNLERARIYLHAFDGVVCQSLNPNQFDFLEQKHTVESGADPSSGDEHHHQALDSGVLVLN